MRLRGIGISERGLRRGFLAATLLGLIVAAPSSGRAAEAKAPPKGEGVINGPTFIQLSPIVLPVFDGNKVVRQAGLVLALELEPGKTEADLEPNKRRLYDAFIADLYGLYDQTGGNDRVIDSAVIKQVLHETSDRVLGPGFVKEVLIQQAFERKRN